MNKIIKWVIVVLAVLAVGGYLAVKWAVYEYMQPKKISLEQMEEDSRYEHSILFKLKEFVEPIQGQRGGGRDRSDHYHYKLKKGAPINKVLKLIHSMEVVVGYDDIKKRVKKEKCEILEENKPYYISGFDNPEWWPEGDQQSFEIIISKCNRQYYRFFIDVSKGQIYIHLFDAY